MGIAMESTAASLFNLSVAETVYYGAISASCELAQLYGKCDGWSGSPGSEQKLQYDMWGVTPTAYNWPVLKDLISKHGLRNLLSVTQSSLPPGLNISGVNGGVEPIAR